MGWRRPSLLGIARQEHTAKARHLMRTFVGRGGVRPSAPRVKMETFGDAMREKDGGAKTGDELAEWDGVTASQALAAPEAKGALRERIGKRLDAALARVLAPFARRATDDAAPLARTGGAVARWISFPRGVRLATAATSTLAATLAAWGVLALAGNELGVAAAAVVAGAALGSASGALGVRLANRLHRLIASRRRYRVSELRPLPDRRAVAVRGVVVARRTASSALEGRQVVWSLVRFRKSTLLPTDFFHEVAFDFLLDDGSDEPIWVEVEGGMLLDPFPPAERVQFGSTTLLEIEHPFLTRLRLDDREVRGAELTIAPGDVVEVVGRLSRRIDPTAASESGRDQPRRRALRSGTRVPVMVKRVLQPDLDLSRVRRLLPKGPPTASPGEPPVRKF